jgi:hypothetical protein
VVDLDCQIMYTSVYIDWPCILLVRVADLIRHGLLEGAYVSLARHAAWPVALHVPCSPGSRVRNWDA